MFPNSPFLFTRDTPPTKSTASTLLDERFFIITHERLIGGGLRASPHRTHVFTSARSLVAVICNDIYLLNVGYEYYLPMRISMKGTRRRNGG